MIFFHCIRTIYRLKNIVNYVNFLGHFTQHYSASSSKFFILFDSKMIEFHFKCPCKTKLHRVSTLRAATFVSTRFFSKSLAWAFQVKPHAFNAYSIGIYSEWINCYFFLFLHIFHILHHNSNSNIWTMCKLYCPVTSDVHKFERQSRLFCLHTHILDCYEPIMNVFPTVSQKWFFS